MRGQDPAQGTFYDDGTDNGRAPRCPVHHRADRTGGIFVAEPEPLGADASSLIGAASLERYADRSTGSVAAYAAGPAVVCNCAEPRAGYAKRAANAELQRLSSGIEIRSSMVLLAERSKAVYAKEGAMRVRESAPDLWNLRVARVRMGRIRDIVDLCDLLSDATAVLDRAALAMTVQGDVNTAAVLVVPRETARDRDHVVGSRTRVPGRRRRDDSVLESPCPLLRAAVRGARAGVASSCCRGARG